MTKSAFELFSPLWPKERHGTLKPLLDLVPVLHYPDDRALLSKVMPAQVIVVIKNAELSEVVNLLELGFEHCVQRERADFAQEILASALMILRQEAFRLNPMPFFFGGTDLPDQKDPDQHISMTFHRSVEKPTVLDWLGMFLQKNPATSTVRDLAMQCADEMMLNALFNAPMKHGKRQFQNLPRDAAIEVSADKKATLFATLTNERLIVGCADVFGSLSREALLSNLRVAFKGKQVSTGATRNGLGFRFLIENAANTYVVSRAGEATLIACGFLLQGQRANMGARKHFHWSFR